MSEGLSLLLAIAMAVLAWAAVWVSWVFQGRAERARGAAVAASGEAQALAAESVQRFERAILLYREVREYSERERERQQLGRPVVCTCGIHRG